MGEAGSRDRTEAAALRIAYENLLRLGWKFSAVDIGKTAAGIINALDAARAALSEREG